MEPTHVIAAILGSSVLSSFLTSWFGKINADKSIHVKNVTKERKEWRDRLRKLVVITAKAFHNRDVLPLKKVEAELIVRLNPEDIKDLEILDCFKKLYTNWNDDDLEQFNDRIAYLLKHDWERVKQECSAEITPQTLALASVFATIFLVLGGCWLSMPYDFFPVGFWVVVFFAAIAVFKEIINIYVSMKTKNYSTGDFWCFWVNRTWRMSYKKREDRK